MMKKPVFNQRKVGVDAKGNTIYEPLKNRVTSDPINGCHFDSSRRSYITGIDGEQIETTTISGGMFCISDYRIADPNKDETVVKNKRICQECGNASGMLISDIVIHNMRCSQLRRINVEHRISTYSRYPDGKIGGRRKYLLSGRYVLSHIEESGIAHYADITTPLPGCGRGLRIMDADAPVIDSEQKAINIKQAIDFERAREQKFAPMFTPVFEDNRSRNAQVLDWIEARDNLSSEVEELTASDREIIKDLNLAAAIYVLAVLAIAGVEYLL